MKRITLMVAAVLMAGILAGCATTSGTTVKKTGNLSSVDKNEETLRNDFFKIINQSEITSLDWKEMNTIKKDIKRKVEPKYGTADDWYKEFLNDKKERNHNSLTGKIINKTNETLHLVFHVRRNQNRWFYFEVPAKSEKYFNIPKVMELKESALLVKYPAEKSDDDWLVILGVQSPDKINPDTNTASKSDQIFADYMSYVFDNYSFVMTFEENTKKQNYKTFDNWSFVKRFETEENLLTKVLDYNQQLEILNKYR